MVGKSLLFGIRGGKSQCNALPTKQTVCGSTNSQHFCVSFIFLAPLRVCLFLSVDCLLLQQNTVLS